MPVVRIEFDDTKVSQEDAQTLCNAVHKLVSEATKIDDVPVYGNSARLKVKISPIEIFVEMSDHKIKNVDETFGAIKSKISAWKREVNFKIPINLTVVPMNWKYEVDI